MKLKEYIVVKTPTGRIDLWMTKMFEEVKRNNPPDYDNYRIITTFDPNEELKEGGGMKTKEEILDKHLFNKFDDADRSTFLAAMDEYAAQFAGAREEQYKKALEEVKYLVDRHSGWDAGEFLGELSSIITIALKPIKEG